MTPVAERLSDEMAVELIERSTHDRNQFQPTSRSWAMHNGYVLALTELQHRRAEDARAPDGWVLVPRKSTDQMYVAFREALDDSGHIYRFVEAYEAMLAASPSSPACGVRVKHLDWVRDHIRDEWLGNPPAPFTGPGYLILADGRWCKRDGVRIWVLDQSGDVEAAKAACQADYEARIRSTLGEQS